MQEWKLLLGHRRRTLAALALCRQHLASHALAAWQEGVAENLRKAAQAGQVRCSGCSAMVCSSSHILPYCRWQAMERHPYRGSPLVGALTPPLEALQPLGMMAAPQSCSNA